MLLLIPITAVLLAIAIAALGIRIWIKGAFADTEIGRNENMRKRGIRCVKEEETRRATGNETENYSACSSCSGRSSCLIR